MFTLPEMPLAPGRSDCSVHGRKGTTSRPVWWGRRPHTQALAPPAVHEQREQLVEDVAIEPATASTAVRSTGEHRTLDLEKFARRKPVLEVEDQEVVDEQIA
jgi:hypothetical protein